MRWYNRRVSNASQRRFSGPPLCEDIMLSTAAPAPAPQAVPTSPNRNQAFADFDCCHNTIVRLIQAAIIEQYPSDEERWLIFEELLAIAQPRIHARCRSAHRSASHNGGDEDTAEIVELMGAQRLAPFTLSEEELEDGFTIQQVDGGELRLFSVDSTVLVAMMEHQLGTLDDFALAYQHRGQMSEAQNAAASATRTRLDGVLAELVEQGANIERLAQQLGCSKNVIYAAATRVRGF
jgi:hypothetical protein